MLHYLQDSIHQQLNDSNGNASISLKEFISVFASLDSNQNGKVHAISICIHCTQA